MNHKFCLISTKYVINPALIHIAHYITADIENRACCLVITAQLLVPKYSVFSEI